MSHTVSSQHPAVVLRPSYQHLRALLAIAAAVILGLTVAVVVLATNSNHVTLASPTTQSAIHPGASAETGAKLDHSGGNAAATQTTNRLATYPDAPPSSAGAPHPEMQALGATLRLARLEAIGLLPNMGFTKRQVEQISQEIAKGGQRGHTMVSVVIALAGLQMAVEKWTNPLVPGRRVSGSPNPRGGRLLSGGGTASPAHAGNGPGYACLGAAQRCLR